MRLWRLCCNILVAAYCGIARQKDNIYIRKKANRKKNCAFLGIKKTHSLAYNIHKLANDQNAYGFFIAIIFCVHSFIHSLGSLFLCALVVCACAFISLATYIDIILFYFIIFFSAYSFLVLAPLFRCIVSSLPFHHAVLISCTHTHTNAFVLCSVFLSLPFADRSK